MHDVDDRIGRVDRGGDRLQASRRIVAAALAHFVQIAAAHERARHREATRRRHIEQAREFGERQRPPFGGEQLEQVERAGNEFDVHDERLIRNGKPRAGRAAGSLRSV